MSATLKIPADFKAANVATLKKINEKAIYPVKEVYGSIPGFTTSARPNHLLPQVGLEKAMEYLERLKDAEIEFDYLLNAPPANLDGDAEFGPQVERLIKLGIKRFTISDPKMVAFLTLRGAKTVVSTVVGIKDQSTLQDFCNDTHLIHGVCVIEDLNRNIHQFASLTRSFPEIEFETVVNTMCLVNCPVRQLHYSAIPFYKANDLDSYGIFCDKLRLDKPVEFLRTPWLLPEHLQRLQEIGIKKFKLAGREFFGDYSYPFVEAYASGRYEGDLLGILLLGGSGNYANLLPLAAKDVRQLVPHIWDTVPNCCRSECEKCRLCDQWAEKTAAQLNTPEATRFRRRLEEVRAERN